MTNFEKITASPDVLGEFLAPLPVATGPWDEEFHRVFCDSCELLECRTETCPHKRNRPLWWLSQVETGEGQNRIVLWVKSDGYRKTMEEFARKVKEARSKRVKATGDKTFTNLEALLAELVEVLLPDMKCRVVMDYDPDAEKGYFYPLVKAALGNDTAQTKTDSITFGTNSTTFTVFACESGDWRLTEEFATEAEAVKWLKAQFRTAADPPAEAAG